MSSYFNLIKTIPASSLTFGPKTYFQPRQLIAYEKRLVSSKFVLQYDMACKCVDSSGLSSYLSLLGEGLEVSS